MDYFVLGAVVAVAGTLVLPGSGGEPKKTPISQGAESMNPWNSD
jgi:hypothetical protein